MRRGEKFLISLKTVTTRICGAVIVFLLTTVTCAIPIGCDKTSTDLLDVVLTGWTRIGTGVLIGLAFVLAFGIFIFLVRLALYLFGIDFDERGR